MQEISFHHVGENQELDYEQSLFPLKDSRGKRTSERARTWPVALKRDARVA